MHFFEGVTVSPFMFVLRKKAAIVVIIHEKKNVFKAIEV